MRSLSCRSSVVLFSAVIGVASVLTGTAAFAESHPTGVPQLSSRPGAAYTIYLDPSGFNYVGAYNGTDTTDPDGNPTGGMVPGYTPPLDDVSVTGSFNANQQQAITTIWKQVTASYIGMNVNVTTVDPAPAAALSSDTLRRNFYDSTPNIMHTVLGDSDRAAYVSATNPSGNWLPGADGVSPGIGVVAGRVDGTNSLQGQHTNFMFTQAEASGNAVISYQQAEYIGGISSHENAHSFGLLHQGDYNNSGGNHINEYSFGDDRNSFQQPGTYTPIIGDGNGGQRIAWRVGTDDNNVNGVYQQENDLKVMLATDSAAASAALGRSGGADLHFINDGVGHTIATATPLPLVGNTVDVNAALSKGVIVPNSESSPTPIGTGNYTTDWFSFASNGLTPITLTATDATDFLTPGVADDVGTLRSILDIFNSSGVMVGAATENNTTMIDNYSGLLGAGNYYAEIESFGGHQQVNAANYDPAYYYDTGAFFLTGSGFSTSVPEPTSIAFVAVSTIGLLSRRRRTAK